MGEFDRLVRQLGETDESTVIAAAHALGDLGDQRAVPELLRLLANTEYGAVRNAAAVGLRELKDPAAAPALLRAIGDPRNVTNRGTLIYALETLDARSAVVDLARAMLDGNYEVMVMALQVIMAFEGPLAREQRDEALDVLREATRRGVLREPWQEQILSDAVQELERLPVGC